VAVPHDGDPVTNTAQSNVTATVSDPDGDPFTLMWRDASGSVVGTSAALDIPLTVGVYTFTLTVVDSYNASTSSSITITVNPESQFVATKCVFGVTETKGDSAS